MSDSAPPIDVFISYKREDMARAKALAEALALRGYSVWWDIDLMPGDRFADEILAVIKRARATIVLWSAASVTSGFVRAEATAADGLERLIPARLDDCELPLPFNVLHTHDLRGWGPGVDEVVLAPLFKAIEKRTGKAPTAAPQAATAAVNLHRPDREAALWKSISEQQPQSAEEYAHYLQAYPEGTFAELARLRLGKLGKGKPGAWLDGKRVKLGAAAAAVAGIVGLLASVTEYRPPPRESLPRPGAGSDVEQPVARSEAVTAQPTTPTAGEEVGPAIAERGLQPGDRFRDCAECPEMVVVPAGSFLMGSPDGEEGRHSDGREGPLHRVTIAEPFAIGVYEVTRGQFATFVEATGHDAGNGCYTFSDGSWVFQDGRNWRSPGFEQSDEHPVVCVRWDDARAYVDWLNAELGFEGLYRLPSEAEWEYAARAGTESRRFWGDDLEDREGCAFANAADLTAKDALSWSPVMNCRDDHVYTAPVGAFTANDFGLHDALGNAWEWVEDCWNGSYAEAGRPDDGSAWTTGDCSRRVLRGGSWLSDPSFLRAATRGGNGPVIRNSNVGFRVARTLR